MTERKLWIIIGATVAATTVIFGLLGFWIGRTEPVPVVNVYPQIIIPPAVKP